MDKTPLIILTGPTAVGKTHLSILLAKKIGGEIISADSMQVYKHMDIGTAKITAEEMQGIPHYLIDCYEPDQDFNVVLFQNEAKRAIKKIIQNGHIPIMVGGTGFYIQSVLYDVDFTEGDNDPELRQKLEQEAALDQGKKLYDYLLKIDPAATEYIHRNNIKRVIRAVEYYKITGKPISEHNKRQHENEPAYQTAYFVLTKNRESLYNDIDKRVDLMIEKGLVKEVKSLLESGINADMISMQGLGYKEILQYLNGIIPLEEAIERIKQNTRHFAKRQLTWFRREHDIIWVNKDEYSLTQPNGEITVDNEKILVRLLHELTLRKINEI